MLRKLAVRIWNHRFYERENQEKLVEKSVDEMNRVSDGVSSAAGAKPWTGTTSST